MDYIIERKDIEKVNDSSNWVLLYGRRKVGKTFLLKNLCKIDLIYTIKKDLSVISPKGNIEVKDMLIEIKNLLSSGKIIVIDEFQRLNHECIEELTLLHPKGKLILSGSSLRIIQKIFEPKSPLLGFFTPIKLGFISPSDSFLSLSKKFDEQKSIELSTFLREPWLIPSYGGEDIAEFLYKILIGSKQIISSLVGEVFSEEERELSKKYEAILSLIGSGVWDVGKLSSLLYSKGIIPSASQTHLIQYIKNLEEMEILESIKLYNSKKNYYRIKSPLMGLFFYLDGRYNISARDVSFEEIKPTLEKLINLEIQNFLGELFAEIYGGKKEYFLSADKEIDFIITIRNKPLIIGEVKWGKLASEDIERFIEISEDYSCRKVLICKKNDKNKKNEKIEIVQARDVLNLTKNFGSKKGFKGN